MDTTVGHGLDTETAQSKENAKIDNRLLTTLELTAPLIFPLLCGVKMVLVLIQNAPTRK